MNYTSFFRNKLLTILLVCISPLFAGAPPLNLFNPYDVLLIPRLWPYTNWQINIADEVATHARSFQADDDDLCDSWRKRKDILQLWQDEQDALAAVKCNVCNNLGQFHPYLMSMMMAPSVILSHVEN